VKDNIIKAEHGDIVQYLLGKYNNHQICCTAYFEKHLNIVVLHKTVAISMNTFPILQSCFVLGNRPWWKIDNKLCDRALSTLSCVSTDESEIINRTLTSSIDIFKGPQIQFTLIKSEMRDILCIKLNHMVSDAGGMKEFLYYFASIYTGLVLKDYPVSHYIATRNSRQLTLQLSVFQKTKMIIHHYYKSDNLKTSKQTLHYNLSGSLNAEPFIVKHEFFLDKLINFSKDHHVTINDLLMTAFIRAIYKAVNVPKTESITIPCPVDIRKYLPDIGVTLFCNLSPVIFCNIGTNIGDTFQETLSKVKIVMDKEKQNLPDAKIATNMKLRFLVNHIPFTWFKTVFIKIFPNPAFVMTNIGVIQKDKLKFGEMEPSNVVMSGSIKEPPALQLAISTYDRKMTFSINLRGSGSDKEKIDSFMDLFISELQECI